MYPADGGGIMQLTTSKLFVMILFLGVFVVAADNVKDPDFWWHLRAGEYIVETHTIPQNDPFAFTTAGRPWSTHEWLSEVFLWQWYNLFGLPGLSLFFAALITSAYAFVFIRSPGQPYVAGFATFLAAVASLPILNVRPQIFSLFFLSLLIFTLDIYFKMPKSWILVAVPLMMVLWVNLHGGFLLGIVVICGYLVGKSIELFIGKHGDDEPAEAYLRQDLFRFAGALVLAVLLTGLNPSGYRIYFFPVGTLSSPIIQRLIVEWFSPDFHEFGWAPLAILLLGIMALGLFARKRFSLTTIGLLVASAYAALRTVRNVPLFTVVAAPVMSSQLTGLVNVRAGEETPPRPIRLILGGVLAVTCLLAILVVGLRLGDQPKSDRELFPVGTVEWVWQHQPEGRLFNTYHWGGYLIWNLYPRYPVFIDGRAELYGDQMLTEYADIYNTRSGWEDALDSYGIRLVLVEPDSLIAQRLTESPNWSQAYVDKTSVLLVRK
jgi:hypothetical protein